LYEESPDLIPWLAQRSSHIPATRGDKVILASLPEEFLGLSADSWTASKSSWQTMLTARNPVYRLIALRNASHFETEPASLTAIYRTGLGETNTLLQNAAFQGLNRLGTPAARAALQEFLDQNKPANDRTMPDAFDINAAIKEYLTTGTVPP